MMKFPLMFQLSLQGVKIMCNKKQNKTPSIKSELKYILSNFEDMLEDELKEGNIYYGCCDKILDFLDDRISYYTKKLKCDTCQEDTVFLKALSTIASYWANIKISPENLTPTENEIEYRINGVIHSILVLIKGNSAANDFHQYQLFYGGKEIGEDSYLPSQYFKVWGQRKEQWMS